MRGVQSMVDVTGQTVYSCYNSDFGTPDQTPTATRVYVDKMEQMVYEVWWTKWDKQCTEYSGQNEIIFQNTYVRQYGMEGGQSMLDKTGHTVYRVWLTKQDRQCTEYGGQNGIDTVWWTEYGK